MFQRFGPFNGGATLSAAEAVLSDRPRTLGRDVFEAIDSLVDKSLVRNVAAADSGAADEEARFAMLATIREYALERLDASADAKTVPHKHAEHFLALAELRPTAVDRRARQGVARSPGGRSRQPAECHRLGDRGR